LFYKLKLNLRGIDIELGMLHGLLCWSQASGNLCGPRKWGDHQIIPLHQRQIRHRTFPKSLDFMGKVESLDALLCIDSNVDYEGCCLSEKYHMAASLLESSFREPLRSAKMGRPPDHTTSPATDSKSLDFMGKVESLDALLCIDSNVDYEGCCLSEKFDVGPAVNHMAASLLESSFREPLRSAKMGRPPDHTTSPAT
jgi:hypothetical protein